MEGIIQPEKQKFLQVIAIDLTRPVSEIAKEMEDRLTEMWDNNRGIERVVGSPNVLLIITAPRGMPTIAQAMPMPGFKI